MTDETLATIQASIRHTYRRTGVAYAVLFALAAVLTGALGYWPFAIAYAFMSGYAARHVSGNVDDRADHT